MSAAVVTELLRRPTEVARRCREDDGVAEVVRAALACTALGAAIFGAVLGSFRGGPQVAYSAIKMPLAILGTLAICVPAFHALAAGLGRPWPVRSVVALVLASVARASLVLLCLAPIAWLAIDWGLGYHASVLLAAAAYGTAGLAALGLLLRGLGDGSGRLLTALSFVAVFAAVGGQMAWSLRPYLGRPSQDEVPFVRAPEGTFADALVRSGRSSVGIYDVARRSVREESWPPAEPSAFDPPKREVREARTVDESLAQQPWDGPDETFDDARAAPERREPATESWPVDEPPAPDDVDLSQAGGRTW